MEPSKQTGDAASSLPTEADLQACLSSIRLGDGVDPASSQPQPQLHHPAVASSTLPNPPPQQLLARTAAPVVGPHGPLLQPQASSYCFFELSPADRIFRRPTYDGSWRFQSPPQASSYGDLEFSPPAYHNRGLANGSPFMNNPATRPPLMAPRRSNLNVNAQEYRPLSRSHLSGEQPSIPSTSQNGSGSFDPGTSGDALADIHGRQTTDQALLMSAESSGRTVQLLAAGDERERERVLHVARPVMHRLMRSREGNQVFLALLQACEGRFKELQGIVEAVCNGKGYLKGVVEDDLGQRALKELIIKVVAGGPDLRSQLINGLFCEEAMGQSRSHVLLRHCFDYLPCDREIIIQRAVDAIDDLLSSPFGARCLEVCLAYATSGALRALEDSIVRRTRVIAKNRHSYHLLENVLRLQGNERLKVRIAEHVGQNIVELSVHAWGHYVVEACILWPAPPEARRLVLTAILRLHHYALQELVQGLHSSDVVVKLLTVGKQTLEQGARALAMRIEALPAAVLAQEHANQVMEAIGELF